MGTHFILVALCKDIHRSHAPQKVPILWGIDGLWAVSLIKLLTIELASFGTCKINWLIWRHNARLENTILGNEAKWAIDDCFQRTCMFRSLTFNMQEMKCCMAYSTKRFYGYLWSNSPMNKTYASEKVPFHNFSLGGKQPEQCKSAHRL